MEEQSPANALLEAGDGVANTHKRQHNDGHAKDREGDAQGLQSESDDERYDLELVREVCTAQGSGRDAPWQRQE